MELICGIYSIKWGFTTAFIHYLRLCIQHQLQIWCCDSINLLLWIYRLCLVLVCQWLS